MASHCSEFLPRGAAGRVGESNIVGGCAGIRAILGKLLKISAKCTSNIQILFINIKTLLRVVEVESLKFKNHSGGINSV